MVVNKGCYGYYDIKAQTKIKLKHMEEKDKQRSASANGGKFIAKLMGGWMDR